MATYGRDVTSRGHTAELAFERLQALSRRAYLAAAGHVAVEASPPEHEPARRRWAVVPRVALSAVVLLAAVAGFVGVRAVSAAGHAEPVPVARGDSWSSAQDALAGDGGGVGSSSAREADAPGPDAHGGEAVAVGEQTAGIVVHVAGQVSAPGIVVLPTGSRVHEALSAAGGATAGADLAAVNLARVLSDGEQVYVPAPGEIGGGATSGPASAATGQTLVDLNRATATELETLPGIGPVLAGRIDDWRSEHGRFTVVEELAEVSGIGPALLEGLRDRVTV